MRTSHYIPQPTRHRTGQAVVRLCGRDFYLGIYGSAEAKTKYDELITQWLANGRRLPEARCTVNEVILAYLRHCKGYYSNSPKEVDKVVFALRPLKATFGRLPADEFGPLKLKATRDRMLETQKRTVERIVTEGKQKRKEKQTLTYLLARRTINQRIGVVKRMFKWAVENEIVPASIHQALSAVPGLKEGRSSAKETEPIRPVKPEQVEAVLKVVNRHLAAMIRLQRLTGARSGEIVVMREADIDMTHRNEGLALWVYRPTRHKNSHRGQSRSIYLGPQAQEVIKPFLGKGADAYLFSPREAVAERMSELRKTRKSKVQPSQRSRAKAVPKRKPGLLYTSQSFWRAVTSACVKAGIEPWHPHQLRHAAATEIRRIHGVEMARIILGHSTAFTTEIYAEADQGKAMEVMTRMG
jgi:integrase